MESDSGENVKKLVIEELYTAMLKAYKETGTYSPIELELEEVYKDDELYEENPELRKQKVKLLPAGQPEYNHEVDGFDGIAEYDADTKTLILKTWNSIDMIERLISDQLERVLIPEVNGQKNDD